jgi:DNA-directed RNA polymerase specialized sigma subunit
MNFLSALLLFLSFNFPQPDTAAEPAARQTETTTTEKKEAAKGYWVIQHIAGISDKVLVLYYNGKNELVKKEWRSAEQVDISKSRVVRSLKKSLQEAMNLETDEYWN